MICRGIPEIFYKIWQHFCKNTNLFKVLNSNELHWIKSSNFIYYKTPDKERSMIRYLYIVFILIIASCSSSQLESELAKLQQENESLENEISEVKEEFVFLEEEFVSVKDELNKKIKELQDKKETVSYEVTNLSYYVSDMQNSINNGWDYYQDWDYTLSTIQNNLNNITYSIDKILSNY